MQKTFAKQLVQFGSEVKRLRELQSMTQQALADSCEVDIRTIQRVERGEHGIGLPLFFAISQSFDISPRDLLTNIQF